MVPNSFFTRQFVHFLMAGGIAATVNFGVGWSLAGLVPLYGDIVVGYLAGMLTAFFLYEKNVFGENGESRKKSVVLFVAVNLFGLLQTWAVYALMKDALLPALQWIFYPAELSRAVAIAVPMFTSFLGHKFYTFQQ